MKDKLQEQFKSMSQGISQQWDVPENFSLKNPEHVQYSLNKLATLLDDQFQVLGFGFGINSLINLVPIAGDIVSTLTSLYVFFQARQFKLPWYKQLRMLLNIGLFFITSWIPVLGDWFGAWLKPNKRNMAILNKHLDRYIASRS